MLIEYIDAIARKKQRTVLYITFHPPTVYEDCGSYCFESDPNRKRVISWLDEHNIKWQMCGPVARETFNSCMGAYLGEIYIDVPFDENDPVYQIVREYIENPDGTMRDEQVCWYYLPFEKAMENAHHDEPGFWEKLSEKW